MPDNPFKPPGADLRDPPPKPGSPVRAILVGLAVDIGGSFLIGMLLTVAYAQSLVSSGMTPEQIETALRDLPTDSPVAVLGVLLGSLCSVAGGFVCARIVRRDEYRVTAIMAALSAFVGESMVREDTPADMQLLYSLATIACVLLGAKYGRAVNRRRAG